MTSNTVLRSRVDSFVAEFTSIVRRSALEVVQEALGGAAPAKRGPGSPMKAVSAPRAGKRIRRDSQSMLELAARVHNAIKASPGQSAEQLGASLRMPTKALALPIKKLLADKVVRTEGQRRGTRYFAAGAKAPAGTKPAAAKRVAPKPAKKRKPMTPEAKAALLERLAKARAARAAKSGA